MSAVLKTDIRIEQEGLSEALIAEMLPLGQSCWNESTVAKHDTCAYYGERDFAVDPDLERYRAIFKSGRAMLMTLRHAGALKGYLIAFTYRSMHQKKILCAAVDSVYIDPEYRSYSTIVCEKFEQALLALNVEIIGWNTHTNGPLYHLLKARGYVGDDVVMEKRLRKGP